VSAKEQTTQQGSTQSALQEQDLFSGALGQRRVANEKSNGRVVVSFVGEPRG
jgi:hypothetical protein